MGEGMVQNIVRFSCFLALLFACSIRANSQSDSQKQFWPEVNVYIPVAEKVRLFFLVTATETETKEHDDGQVGAHIDYAVNKRIVLRAGYRYGFSIDSAEPFKEHRPITEQTFRQQLPLNILLTDRNRQDFRVVNGDFSFRYRNRLMLEREFMVMGRSLTPYGSIEVYYDTRFKVWNRNRLTAGMQIQLRRAFPLLRFVIPRKQIVWDVYYTKQNDSRSDPHHVNALGMALSIHF